MNEQTLAQYFQLSSDNSKLLSQQAKLFQFEQTGPVIHKGQAVSGAYLVLQGQLRVFTYSPVGTEATLYLLNPGDTCVLTLNCLFNNLRYPAWVEASANSCAALIPGDLYKRFFAEEESVRATTVKALSTLVFRLMDELEEVHSCNLEQRLIHYLINSMDVNGVVAITQQRLANHLGTTREVVAKLIQGLTTRSLIRTTRGRIMVQDTVKLAALVTPTDAMWP